MEELEVVTGSGSFPGVEQASIKQRHYTPIAHRVCVALSLPRRSALQDCCCSVSPFASLGHAEGRCLSRATCTVARMHASVGKYRYMLAPLEVGADNSSGGSVLRNRIPWTHGSTTCLSVFQVTTWCKHAARKEPTADHRGRHYF